MPSHLQSVAGLVVFVALAAGSQRTSSPNDLSEWNPGPQATPPAAPASVSLNAFFAGIEAGCSKNPELQAALDSMGTPGAGYSAWTPAASVKTPAALAGVFGAPYLANSDASYSVLAVDVSGATWFGFPVTHISRWVGHGNGINGFAFTVDAPHAQVQAAVTAALDITDSCADDSACPVGPFQMAFEALDDGTTDVSCDTST